MASCRSDSALLDRARSAWRSADGAEALQLDDHLVDAGRGEAEEAPEIGLGGWLDRRIADKLTLISEISTWELRRNRDQARIDWMFTVERAREKLGRAYPRPAGPAPARDRRLAA